VEVAQQIAANESSRTTGLSGVTPTRNWILANARDKCVVMLDDDVKRAGWVRLEKQNSTYHPLPNEAS